jgi:hypothetical protein
MTHERAGTLWCRFWLGLQVWLDLSYGLDI